MDSIFLLYPETGNVALVPKVASPSYLVIDPLEVEGKLQVAGFETRVLCSRSPWKRPARGASSAMPVRSSGTGTPTARSPVAMCRLGSPSIDSTDWRGRGAPAALRPALNMNCHNCEVARVGTVSEWVAIEGAPWRRQPGELETRSEP